MDVVTEFSVCRGDVFLVALNPTRGQKIRKTRTCLIMSPDELNAHFSTFIVAPLTTGGHPYPFRVACSFQGKAGFIVPDQLRTVDRERLVKRLGTLEEEALDKALGILRAMFAP